MHTWLTEDFPCKTAVLPLAMHVDGAGAQPWSERDFPDHALPGWTAEIQDTQALGKIQTGLDFEGSVEAKQSRPTAERELKSLREQLATYKEMIRPKNPKLKLSQKRIDPELPLERAWELLKYAGQLQHIHKGLPTSPKDRLLFRWRDNPVMFDAREPPRPSLPSRQSILKKSKTMDTGVEKMMEKLSIKSPSFKGMGSRTRVVKSNLPHRVSKVPKSSSRSPLAERIAPISLTPGTLSGDPLNEVMDRVAREKLASLHDLLDKIMPLEKAREKAGTYSDHYASLQLQRLVFRTVQFMHTHELISSKHLEEFFSMKDTLLLATMNVAHSFSVSWLSNFRQSESPFFGFWYSEDFARFVERFVDEVE
ncbi:hypothetical protein Pst134EB_016474 [Puccinia striiformis f. sp. tritici]|nr:hypothetical protein Pst134EB_016474 [Puccinia striiformis f. sp. tritici]